MKNTILNKKVTIKIAKALGELNEKVVFVGGAIVSFYIDDPTADDVRPTKDVDISLEIASLGALEKLREALNNKGFQQSHEDKVMCRFRYEDVKVDVMTTHPVGWAPANPWFAPGFERKQEISLDDIRIRILPLPYFISTKLAAFNDRGRKDPRTSHDFEDIVYLLNYTSSLKNQILQADKDVKFYLKEFFLEISNSSILQEAIKGNLLYDEQTTRFEKIMNILRETTKGL